MTDNIEQQPMASEASDLQSPKRGISRRSMVLWFAGVIAAEIVASGITWQKVLQELLLCIIHKVLVSPKLAALMNCFAALKLSLRCQFRLAWTMISLTRSNQPHSRIRRRTLSKRKL